jgi:phosphopantothenoylcysteine synthetase/decarboxylase
MKYLLTSGGTREPIDAVRYIGNKSTGATGAQLAEIFASAGNSVTCLIAEGAALPQNSTCEIFRYTDFQSLDVLIKKQLQEQSFDAVIHLAAVSDYSVALIETQNRTQNQTQALNSHPPSPYLKLDSGSDLILHLKKNFKIIDRIKKYAQGELKLVGFKLTATDNAKEAEKAVNALFDHAPIDFVVHNSTLSTGENRVFSFYKNRKKIE